MNPIRKLFDALVYAMAGLAGVLLLTMMVLIVSDIALRQLGSSVSAHFFAFTEYLLLLIPLLGGPWLVREKAHVTVEVLLITLPVAARERLMRVLCVLCLITCGVLAWFGLQITIQAYVQADMDMRSFDMPRWVLLAFMPLSFGMMAFEFLRLLQRGEPMAQVGSVVIPDKDN
ncbi:MAG: hypothetical protein RL019_2023 [Pseudomonadota bacterium]|jgi:TRAP-type C4-dicarboxylate transport system permease small subunit